MKKTMIFLSLIFIFQSFEGLYSQEKIDDISHYLLPKFVQSTVIMKTGKIIEKDMNFNMVTQKPAYMENKNPMEVTNSEYIDSVYLGEKVFVSIDNIFCEVNYNSNISFYIEHKRNLNHKGQNLGYGIQSQTTSSQPISVLIDSKNIYKLSMPKGYYTSYASSFWVKKNDEFIKFNNERNFLKIFPEKKSELKKFIKENKINIKKDSDLKELAKFTNQLYN